MNTDPPPHDARQSVLEALNAFAIAQNELGRLFARSHGLHPTDASAILQIIAAEDRGKPLTPARLAESLSLTAGATSILLNRLENAGHVSRTREHQDRRMVTLRSTAAVHASADDFYRPVGDQLANVLRDVSEADAVRLGSIIDDIRTRLLQIVDQHD